MPFLRIRAVKDAWVLGVLPVVRHDHVWLSWGSPRDDYLLRAGLHDLRIGSADGAPHPRNQPRDADWREGSGMKRILVFVSLGLALVTGQVGCRSLNARSYTASRPRPSAVRGKPPAVAASVPSTRDAAPVMRMAAPDPVILTAPPPPISPAPPPLVNPAPPLFINPAPPPLINPAPPSSAPETRTPPTPETPATPSAARVAYTRSGLSSV
jgi:hypothetical protein